MPTAREVMDAYTAALNAHDLDGAWVLFRPDVVVVTPDARELKGRDEAAEYLWALFRAFPDARLDVQRKIDSDYTAVDEWIFSGTNSGPIEPMLLPNAERTAATGRHISARGVDIGLIDGGEIASDVIYLDQVQLLTSLGLLWDGE